VNEETHDLPAPLTPDEIARMSQMAHASCQQSATQLRALGDRLAELAAGVKTQCHALADDFEAHGETVARSVVDFANRVFEQGKQVADLKAQIEPPGPRQPGPEVYGARGGGGGIATAMSRAGGAGPALPSVTRPLIR